MQRIHYTNHAVDAVRERNLDKELVESAVTAPDWQEAAEEGLWSAFKRINKKVLRVVVRGKGESVTVVTAYYDRRKV